MHNSLANRDQLRQANAASVFTRFRDPYRTMTISNDGPRESEFPINGEWLLTMEPSFNVDAAAAFQGDLTLLWQRLGATLHYNKDKGEQILALRCDENLAERDACMLVEPGRIVLSGGGVSGLWAAVMWLTWELRVRRAPFLKPGRKVYPAAWALQISQGPLGGNYSVPDLGPEFLSNESLRLYAHSGVNSMMIYGDLLCYTNSTILPQLNHPEADRHLGILQRAGERAARYGVGFTYVPVHPKLAADHPVFLAHPDVRGRGYRLHGNHFHILCSSQSTARAFYAEQYERLFAAVPQLQGVLAITYSESFYHCDMWHTYEASPCPHCASLESDARVVPLLTDVSEAIQRANPNAFLAEWIYSWLPADSGERGLAAIHGTRPQAIDLCQSVDKDPLYDGKTVYQKPGYQKSIWDYSIECDTPTAYVREAADFAKMQKRFFIAKTESGTGIETMQLPYVPALFHLARKWEGVRSLSPDGVHQAWLFYGHHHSRAERLAAWAAYRNDLPANAFLEDMAKADFGAAAPGVLTCWSRFGRAIKHLPCLHLGNYYQSPSFFGPCHPLLPNPNAPVPECFHVSLYYLQEHGRTFTPSQIEDCRVPMVLADLPASPADIGVHLDPGLGWEIIVEEYATAVTEGRLGWDALAAMENLLESPQDRQNWEEEMALAEITWRTFLSCRHVVEFLLARRVRQEDPSHTAALEKMRDVARKEAQNAHTALPVYKKAPWLDPSVRTDGIYPTARTCIEEKCRIIEQFLTKL